MAQTRIDYPADLHAPGAIEQLIAYHRQTFGGFLMEDGAGGDGGGDGGKGGSGGDGGKGSGGGDSDKGGSGGSGGDGGSDLGFPKDTPVAEMSDKEAAAYWRHQSKKHESRASGLSKLTGGKTAEEIKAEQDELVELRKGKMTDTEKAVQEAADKARTEERIAAGQRIARATAEAALQHIDDDDERAEILDGLNLAKYVDKDGEVDTTKVRAYVARISPADTANQRQQQRRDFGGGHRREGGAKRGEAGKAEAERRFGKKTNSSDR